MRPARATVFIPVLALALGLSLSARAAPPGEAKYEAGKAKYEQGDLRGAITEWEASRDEIADDQRRARALIELNLATAYERIYDAEGDRAALERAQALTKSFVARVPTAFEGDEVAVEQRRGQDRIARIEAKLAEPAQPTGPVATPADPPPAEPPPAQPADKPRNAGTGLIASGATLLGVGVAGVAVMGAGMGIAAGANDFGGVSDSDFSAREDQIARGNRGNAMTIAGAVMAGVFVPTGAVLLGIGVKRRKTAKRRAAQVAPTMGPGHAGLVIKGRF